MSTHDHALYTLADDVRLGNSFAMHVSCRVHRFDGEGLPFVVRAERTIRNRANEVVEQTLISQFLTAGSKDDPPRPFASADEARGCMAETYRRFIGKHREG